MILPTRHARLFFSHSLFHLRRACLSSPVSIGQCLGARSSICIRHVLAPSLTKIDCLFSFRLSLSLNLNAAVGYHPPAQNLAVAGRTNRAKCRSVISAQGFICFCWKFLFRKFFSVSSKHCRLPECGKRCRYVTNCVTRRKLSP